MSKPVTTTTPTTPHTTTGVAHEKIAMRAYDKWCKRGRPYGTARQDWLEAEAELRAEMARVPATSPPPPQRR